MNIDHNNQINMQSAGTSRLGRCSGSGAAAPFEDRIMTRIQKTIGGKQYTITRCGYIYCDGKKLNPKPLNPLYLGRIPDLAEIRKMCFDWIFANYSMV